MRGLLAALGRVALTLASAAFLAAVSLLVLGSWLLTFPVLRKSPRERRMKSTMELASALLQAAQAWAPELLAEKHEQEGED